MRSSLLGLFLLACTILLPGARADERPVTITSIEQAQEIEDPRQLVRAADHWRDQGDTELARALYERALSVDELEKYLAIRGMLREALLLERLGDLDGAAARFREGMADDIQATMLVLRIASVHPDRQALFAEAEADLRDRVARAKRGEKVQIYTTSKGEPRYLEVIPDDQVAARLASADEPLRYCYIDNLDLSEAKVAQAPQFVVLSRCVVGRILVPDRQMGTFALKAIVLGDVDIGKTWDGEVNKGKSTPGSRFQELSFRESVFLGRVNVQDVKVQGRNALFPLAVFQGEADFRDTLFHGTADFRYSVFGGGANFKGSHMTEAVYFGNSRYLAPVTFRGMYSEKDVFFNSAEFEASASFDRCEWVRGATFENARFRGPVSFNNSQLGGRLNMSRAVLQDTISIKEMQLSGMDFIGAWLQGDAAFIDVRIAGKVRFSLDDITRAQHLLDPAPLLPLYRDYQGDQDAEEPLTTRSSYGVEHVDDLIARIDGNVSFANSVFEGFTIFERVQFGLPSADAAAPVTTAEFYNTQFLGESHFERTTWYSHADFTTISANELSLNEATFYRTLILDDANVRGRVTMTDAVLSDETAVSFYGAELAAFEVDRDQMVLDDTWSWLWQASEHQRMFYKQCSDGYLPAEDPRLVRLRRGRDYSDDDVREICADRLIDEYVALKQTFGDRAMTGDEDWAYWWIKHTEMTSNRRWGGAVGLASSLVVWPLFEIAFGWGVNLGNLLWTVLVVCGIFVWIYRVFCPDSVMQYNGDDVPVRDIPFWGLYYISLQSLGAFNTGWDFGEDDGRLQYLNTLETFIGVIILTFFVGAYTRMILA